MRRGQARAEVHECRMRITPWPFKLFLCLYLSESLLLDQSRPLDQDAFLEDPIVLFHSHLILPRTIHWLHLPSTLHHPNNPHNEPQSHLRQSLCSLESRSHWPRGQRRQHNRRINFHQHNLSLDQLHPCPTPASSIHLYSGRLLRKPQGKAWPQYPLCQSRWKCDIRRVEHLPCLKVDEKAGDAVLEKNRYYGGRGNSLETILRTQGIDTIILTGLTMSGAVLNTVYTLYNLGYKVSVLHKVNSKRSSAN